jgi:hypothetical protein
VLALSPEIVKANAGFSSIQTIMIVTSDGNCRGYDPPVLYMPSVLKEIANASSHPEPGYATIFTTRML